MGTFVPLLEIWPEMRDVVAPVELGKHILEEGGFPQNAVRNDRDIAAAQQRMQQMQAQQLMTCWQPWTPERRPQICQAVQDTA